MFAEKYLKSLNTSDLRDDEQHRQTEALAAAALADLTGGSGEVLGSLLARAKYADGISHKLFEAGNQNMAVLLRAWIKVVAQKGKDRKWLKIKAEWDIAALAGICEKIARASLAHWLAGECEVCKGTKIAFARACICCAGTGREPIQGVVLEVERIKDMISDLEGLYQSHGARAGAKLRLAA
jgi:hypothetical protein